MKTDIHPAYVSDAKIVCACGNLLITGSTMPEIRVEICSKCHPFYTGKQKLVDTARRVEKYQKRTAAANADTSVTRKKVKKEKRASQKAAKKAQKKPTTLHEA